MEKVFFNSKDIAEITGKSIRTAEKIIKELQEDAVKDGYRVISGLISVERFYKSFGLKQKKDAD